MNTLTRKAYELRRDTTEMVRNSRAGHVGGGLSVTDMLTVLYFKVVNVSPEKGENPGRGRFLLSKGHCADALYCVPGKRGFYDKEEAIGVFSQFGSRFVDHSNMGIPGAEMSSGSLGHGISVGVGMALAARINHRSYRIYVVLGDGGMAGGSNYEGMMAAGHYRLGNLCATADLNCLQISGTAGQVMSSVNLMDKLRGFGQNVIKVLDGNNCIQLVNAYEQTAAYKGEPAMVIVSMVKGKGVSFMENQISWHHEVMTEEQYEQAAKELKEVLQ